jgi:vacuolar-type H+-ATPase subunit E/Vma4
MRQLIVDANCATLTLSPNPNPDFAPVMQAILDNKATLVLGGCTQREEYTKLATVWRFIIALDRAGKAKKCLDSEVDRFEKALKENGSLKSDDPHILALARVSGARLLCSRDKNLHIDFTSTQILDAPKGKVYQNATHAHLLQSRISSKN